MMCRRLLWYSFVFLFNITHFTKRHLSYLSADASSSIRRLPLKDMSISEARSYIKSNLLLSDLVTYLKPTEGLIRISDSESMCLCPFHDDTNPSLRLRDEKKYYHCFACGAHGDVFTFVMKSLDLSYPAAIRHLSILLDSGSLVSTPIPYSTSSSSISSPINQLNRIAAKPAALRPSKPIPTSIPSNELVPEPLPVYFELLQTALQYFSTHLLEVCTLLHSTLP